MSKSEEVKELLRSFYASTINHGMREASYFAEQIGKLFTSKLEKPAMVGNTRFGVGIDWSTVIDRAQREYHYQVTPEKEAERLKRVGAFVDSCQSPSPEESAIPEGCTPADAMVLREANHHFADENQALRRCLRWYANGEHIVGFPTWEGPSGDDNWLCPPMADFGDYRQKFIDTLDEHMVEDGAVARGTLRSGKFEVESPEDEPKVIEGEPEWHVEQQAHSSPQKE